MKYVDLRFTDPRGKMQHLTMDVSQMHEDAWEEGLMFDGSSIAGWKAINESDMILMPDAIVRPHGPLLCPDHHGGVLRHPRAGHGRRLQPRPAHDRQAHRSLSQVHQDRRHGVRRPRSRVLRVRRREVLDLALQDRLQARRQSNCRRTPTATTKPATWATACAPRAATSR